MAGIAAYYYVGKNGGYMGSDGLLSIDLEIAIEVASREALYVTKSSKRFSPISKEFKVFIPIGPDNKDTLRIALIMFASDLFKDCPSFKLVQEEMKGIERVDFNMNDNVPLHFFNLLEESRKVDLEGKVDINMANIYSIDCGQI